MKKIEKLKSFYNQCVRVFRITKKPNRTEFLSIAKVSGLGILAIGLIGFCVHVVDKLV
jgi:protein transport protein SEC61 subunit gamma-like protein